MGCIVGRGHIYEGTWNAIDDVERGSGVIAVGGREQGLGGMVGRGNMR